MGDDVVVALEGELDLLTRWEFHRRLRDLLESSQARTLVLDLSGLGFIDGASTRMIVDGQAAAAAHERDLWVVGLHGSQVRMFAALGLDSQVCQPT